MSGFCFRGLDPRRLGFRAAGVGVVAAVALTASGCQQTKQVPLHCDPGGAIAQTIISDVTPALADDGGVVTYSLTAAVAQRGTAATVNEATVTYPMPAQVASVESVTLTGGNVAGSASVVGSDVVLTVTGPVASDQIELPQLAVRARLKTGIFPSTIYWLTFSSMTADITVDSTSFVQRCVPDDPGFILAVTPVLAPTTTTTVPPAS